MRRESHAHGSKFLFTMVCRSGDARGDGIHLRDKGRASDDQEDLSVLIFSEVEHSLEVVLIGRKEGGGLGGWGRGRGRRGEKGT